MFPRRRNLGNHDYQQPGIDVYNPASKIDHPTKFRMQLRKTRVSRLVALGAVARGVGVRWNFELPVVVLSPRNDDEVTFKKERNAYMMNQIYWTY